MTKAFAVACVVAALAAGLSAEQAPIDPAANAKLAALRKAGPSNAYRKLFEVREGLGKTIEQAKSTAPAAKRKIVCGMTVIEVGPELDPKMAVTRSKNDVIFSARAVPPPICGAKPE